MVPETVVRELRAENAPDIVKAWLIELPQWLSVCAASGPWLTTAGSGLDPGETEAVEIAIALKADLILIDDLHAREFALRLGLPVSGTLGVYFPSTEKASSKMTNQ